MNATDFRLAMETFHRCYEAATKINACAQNLSAALLDKDREEKSVGSVAPLAGMAEAYHQLREANESFSKLLVIMSGGMTKDEMKDAVAEWLNAADMPKQVTAKAGDTIRWFINTYYEGPTQNNKLGFVLGG